MQTPITRGSPKESPRKVSAKPVRQLKIVPGGHSSPSSSGQTPSRTPKDRSPKVPERKSPRSPLPEKKRPSKLSELESQITKLQDDLKTVKDQLVISQSLKREVQEDATEVKRQLVDVTLKLEESQKQVDELVAAKETVVVELQNTSVDDSQAHEYQLQSVRQQQSENLASLEAAQKEIQSLKQQLEKAVHSQDVQEKDSETSHAELQSLKENLAQTLSLVERMKQELKDSQQSEANAQNQVRETLLQLEAAKETVSLLRSDISRSKEAYNSITSELEESRGRISFLESFVSKINVDATGVTGDDAADHKPGEDVHRLKLELQSTKTEVGQLKSALEAAEIRFNDEQSHSCSQIRNASEHLEQMMAQSRAREAKFEAELNRARDYIEELKANIMDKETELQGITEENESLNLKLDKSTSSQRELELENELKKLGGYVAEMKASLLDKETELQNILEENNFLKQEINKQETERTKEQVVAEVEASRAAEQDAMAKLGYVMEEREKSNRKAARVTEQLEAAQAASAEMEAELRKLKVQSDQWRKAAEAAASMLSPGSNGKYVERTGSMPLDSHYSPIKGRISSPYLDDYDDDSYKKKNGNVLKKIGGLWKKPQK